MRNRGIARGRMFMGVVLLVAAIITWAIGAMMSPHGDGVAEGTEHVKTTVVTFMRNGAIGTIILSAISSWFLFPKRRPTSRARDWTVIGLLVLLIGSSVYTLVWLQTSVVH